jgi:hypothetical protein
MPSLPGLSRQPKVARELRDSRCRTGAVESGSGRSELLPRELDAIPLPVRHLANGAAQESNLPSRGLHDLTGVEDSLRK